MKKKESIHAIARHMHPIKAKVLSLVLGFKFFEYLGFGFDFEYFANFEKDNLK